VCSSATGERARIARLNGAVFERPLPPVDFHGLARYVLLRIWQENSDAADTDGIFSHSILPRVFLRPWFDGQREDRKFVYTVSRIMCLVIVSHLNRFKIVEGAICII
jgi:hypothetical protein